MNDDDDDDNDDVMMVVFIAHERAFYRGHSSKSVVQQYIVCNQGRGRSILDINWSVDVKTVKFAFGGRPGRSL